MELALAFTVGVFFAAAIYLLLSSSLVRILLGVAVLGNAVNLLIFVSGRISRNAPPVIPSELYQSEVPLANPLPQALILTAIVISFSLFAFLLVLAYRAYQALGTDEVDDMKTAEAETPRPPHGY